MRALLTLKAGPAVDVSHLPIAKNLLDLVGRLRALGDTEESICEAVGEVCDAPSHPLMLSSIALRGNDLILHADDAEEEATAGEAWLAKSVDAGGSHPEA